MVTRIRYTVRDIFGLGLLMQELPTIGDWLENAHVTLTGPIKINLGTFNLLLEAIFILTFF